MPNDSSCSDLEQFKIGDDPKAIGVVTNANGQNRNSIIVTCHCIIGTNDGLTSHRGKLWRKK